MGGVHSHVINGLMITKAEVSAITCMAVVFTVNFRLLIGTTHWTLFVIGIVLLSCMIMVTAWLIVSSLPETFPATYQSIDRVLGYPYGWITFLSTVGLCLMTSMVYLVARRLLFPFDHQIIQEWQGVARTMHIPKWAIRGRKGKGDLPTSP